MHDFMGLSNSSWVFIRKHNYFPKRGFTHSHITAEDLCAFHLIHKNLPYFRVSNHVLHKQEEEEEQKKPNKDVGF